MEKFFEFKCPECGYDHEDHGALLPKSQASCPECIRKNNKMVSLFMYYPAEKIGEAVDSSTTAVRDKLKSEGLSKQVIEEVMFLVGACLKTQVEACVDTLGHVENENDLTGSDVVWIELENAQNALKSRVCNGDAP